MSIYTSSSALSSPRIRAKARASGRNVCAPGKRRAGRVKRRLRGTRKYGREVGRGAWLVEYRKKRERERDRESLVVLRSTPYPPERVGGIS